MGMRKGSLGAQWVVLPLRKEPRRTCTLARGVGTSPNAWPILLSALPTALRLETGCWAPPTWAPGRGTSQLGAEDGVKTSCPSAEGEKDREKVGAEARHKHCIYRNCFMEPLLLKSSLHGIPVEQ